MKKPFKIAYQLYSARDLAERDLKSVLTQVRKMGYDGVEFAGFYGHSADEIKAMLKETGLTAVSSHVALSELTDQTCEVIRFHKKIGCRHIAVPYLPEPLRPGQEAFSSVIRTLTKLGRAFKKEKIGLLYHNHDFEFEQVSGQWGLDFLYDAVSEQLLQAEIDVCWVRYAGIDPAEYLLQYKGRVPVLHLKDFVGSKEGGTPYGLIGEGEAEANAAFRFRPVGHGCQDLPGLLSAAKEARVKWLIVEMDDSYEDDPLDNAKLSIEAIQQHLH